MNRSSIALLFVTFVIAAGFGCSADGGDNQPPVLVGVPSEERIEVGETLRLTLSAADPEGSEVSFDYTWRPEDANTTLDGATFIAVGAEAAFEWSPIASDVTQDEPIRVIFIAKDGGGKVTEATMALTVAAGNGVPRFTSNASELYDPRIGGPLEFSVQVRDDDSTGVELQMDQSTAPVGSSFQQTGDLEGRYTWEPSPEQLMRRVHSVTFRALDDQDNEAELKVSIVVRTKTSIDVKRDQTNQQCPGEALISHTPLRSQNTLANYPITAQLTGDSDRFDDVFVYWTTADAYNGDFDPQDPEKRLNAIKLEEKNGVWSGEVPNQVDLVASAGTLTVAYNICALDNDATGDDAIVCAPSSGDLEMYYTFSVYRPDAETECIEDPIDVAVGNDTVDTATIITESWTYYRSCNENPDVHVLQVRPGESYLIAGVYPDGQPISFEAFDDSESSVEVKKSSCTGLASFEASVPDGGSTTNFYFQVNGNDVNYQVRAIKTAGGAGGCVDDAIEPNDEALDAHEVAAGDNVTAEICSPGDVDLYAIALNPGDNITVSMNHNAAASNLDLQLYPPSTFAEVGDPNGSSIYTFSTGVDDEVLEHEAEESGTYYLMVFNNNENAADYTLEFEVAGAPPCPDGDSYSSGSGNHTQASASELAFPSGSDVATYDSLTVCPGKPDWYKRAEFSGFGLILGDVTVTGGDGAASDVTVEVYTLSGSLVTSGSVSGNRVEFDYTPPVNGTYFYKVSTTSRVTYELNLLTNN